MDGEIVEGRTTDCYWVEGPDGWWVEVEGLDPRAMTQLMIGREARWKTMTVSPMADGTSRLTYRWDVSGRPLSIATTIADARADSIADLLPAAAWAEREMQQRYAIEFVRRDETPAPMSGQRVGSERFSRTADPGRDYPVVEGGDSHRSPEQKAMTA